MNELEQKATELKQKVNDLVEAVRQEQKGHTGLIEPEARMFVRAVDFLLEALWKAAPERPEEAECQAN